MNIKSYRDLKVWKKAMDLVVNCYKTSHKLPTDETYGLKTQIRRAAVSIPANIAEGHSRWYSKEFIHHLSIAYGSLAELETHLLISARLGYLDLESVNQHIEATQEVGRMINGLRKSLQSK